MRRQIESAFCEFSCHFPAHFSLFTYVCGTVNLGFGYCYLGFYIRPEHHQLAWMVKSTMMLTVGIELFLLVV